MQEIIDSVIHGVRGAAAREAHAGPAPRRAAAIAGVCSVALDQKVCARQMSASGIIGA